MIRDLRSIQILKAVAQHGSISSAAEDLGISQPALTKRIKAIEEDVDLVLFKRDAKGVSLTSNGEFFLEQSEKLIVTANDVNQRLQAFRNGNGGDLRIGSKTGLDDVFFTDVLLQFIKDKPNVHLNVDIDTTPSLIRRLETNDLDLAFVARGYPDATGVDSILNQKIRFIDLCSLTFHFVVRADHPVFKRNSPTNHILKYPLACPKAPRDILNLIANAQQDLNVKFRCPNILIDDYEAVFKIVEVSDHWTAIPAASETVVERMHKLRCVPDLGLIPPLKIGYATRINWDPIPAATHFIQLVKNAVAKLPSASVL